MLAVRPGVRVTLPCPAGRPGDRVQWMSNSSLSAAQSGAPVWGRGFVLEPTLPGHSGNYSCHHNGRPAAFLRLVVEGALCPRSPWRQVRGVPDARRGPGPRVARGAPARDVSARGLRRGLAADGDAARWPCWAARGCGLPPFRAYPLCLLFGNVRLVFHLVSELLRRLTCTYMLGGTRKTRMTFQRVGPRGTGLPRRRVLEGPSASEHPPAWG